MKWFLKLIFDENISFSLFTFLGFVFLLSQPPMTFIISIIAVMIIDAIVRKALNK